MRVTEIALDMIKRKEGCVLSAYLCPAGVLTIGYGHTGPDVHRGLTITMEEARELLRKDVAVFERDVIEELAGAPTKQCQFDALVVLAYNIGSDNDADNIVEGLGDSTLMRKHKAGDYAGAAAEFAKWNKARIRGKMVALPGLTKRRAEEARLYRGEFA